MVRPIASYISSVVAVHVICLGCDGQRPVAGRAADAYQDAVSLSATGDDDGAIASLRRALEDRPESCQRALLDPAFISLRDAREFRDLIRAAVVKHKIASLTLAPPDEPGEWLEIDGQVLDAEKQPVPGALITVFGTAQDGRYHPTIEGEGTPRLFALLVADEAGKFRFRTIRPGPYPGTRNAEHFHVWASAPGKRMAAPHYAVLSDDPLLQLPENSEQRGEAVRVVMQERRADGVTRGTVVLPMR